MSIARGFSPLDIMTLGDFRGANEAGDGLVVLAVSLDTVLWANQAGRTLLGLAADQQTLAPMSGLSRQIRATTRLIETRGEARLLLRPATGLASQPVVADLKRIETPDGVEIVVLAASAPRPATQSLAALADRLLAESGLEDAAIYGQDGAIVSSAAAPAVDAHDLRPEIAALIDSGASERVVDLADARLTLARVARELVLVRRDPSAMPAAAPEGIGERQRTVTSVEPADADHVIEGLHPDARDKAQPTEGYAATSMSAIVRRWHSRGATEGLSSAERPADASAPLEAPVPEEGRQAARGGDETGDVDPSDDQGRDDAQATPAGTSPVSAIAEPAPGPTARVPLRSAWGAPLATPLAPETPTPADRGSVAFDEAAEPSGLSKVTAGDGPAMGDSDAGEQVLLDPADEGPQPPPALSAAMRPMRSFWGAPIAISPPQPTTRADDSDGEAPRPESAGSLPAQFGDGGSPVPNDTPGTGGEDQQPVEKPVPVIVPDVSPDKAAELDDAIIEDAEVPAEEDLVPASDERSLPEQQPTEEMVNEALSEDAAAHAATAAETGELELGFDGLETGAGSPPDPNSDEAVQRSDGTLPLSAGEVFSADMPFEPQFSGAPVRFVWQIDSYGKFRSLTPEFSAAVGPQAADVGGRSFREVADVFGFDTSGEISRLLERRDTWSGRSILWPVQGSDRKVPVDLAALPVYARDRSFDGFRGFGIVRMNESVPDPDGIGLILADFGGFVPPLPEAEPEAGAGRVADESTVVGRPLLKTFEATPPAPTFGRRPEPPTPTAPTTALDQPDPAEDTDALKVIRLEERRRPRDGSLSLAEEAAFRAIGMTLGRERTETRETDADKPTAATDAPARDLAPASPSDTAPARDDGAQGEPMPVALPPDEPGAIDGAQAGAAQTSTLVASGWVVLPTPAQKADLQAEAEGGEDTSVRHVDAAAKEGDARGAAPGHAPDLASSASPSKAGEDAGDEPFVPEAMAEELESIFAALPLPVLVQMHEALIYANREFEDLSGYEDLAALDAAGGLEALFVEPDDPLRQGELAIRRSNGQIAEVRVHMQRVTFAGRSCLMMSFSPSPREIAAETAVIPEHAEPSASDADLRQQVEELQAGLDTATDGVVLLDAAGTIRTMNGSAHALFGIGQAEAAGMHLSSLFAPESQKLTLDYLEMLREEGMAGILNDGREVIGRVAQGGSIPLFITIGRLSGDRGWCVVIRDIAHWKRIEEDLVNARRQAEAASLHKSRFLANISHELRTPLNAIIGFADVMASECFGPIGNERYIEYLGDIKRSGHHVLDLVNDLLDISKIEAGKLDLAFEAVSLNEVISEVVSLMQPQANRERVIVRSNLPSSVPPVVADRRTMRQIALNLIANAIRFTPAGGQIIASTTYTADGEVLLRFRDSGIGMSEREIEIALTPFQQVHAPGAVRGEGTGLGLPLTKAMVEANRAGFAINSTPGEGTLVEIAFPPQRVLAD